MDHQIARRYGMKVKLARTEKKLSLRELSKHSGVSLSMLSRIETALHIPKASTREKIEHVLGFTYEASDTICDMFQSKYDALYRNIIMVDHVQAAAIARHLYETRARYENAPCYPEYYLIMLMYALHMHHYRHVITPYVHAVEQLEDIYSAQASELRLIELANHAVAIGEDKRAETLLNNHERINEDKTLFGINNYLRGILQTKNPSQFKESLSTLKVAQSVFERTNNFFHVMYTKAIAQRVYIYMNRFDVFEELYEDVSRFAQIEGQFALHHYGEFSRVRAEIAQKRYHNALAILRTISVDTLDHRYFTLYARFRLNLVQKGEAVMDQFIPGDDAVETALSKMFFEAIAHWSSHGEDEMFIEKLKAFTDAAFDEAEYMYVKMAYTLYVDCLKRRRRYKLAHQYAERMLALTNAIIM